MRRIVSMAMIIALLVNSMVLVLWSSTSVADTDNPYVVEKFVDKDGRQIVKVTVPGKPPQTKVKAVDVPVFSSQAGYALSNVPAYYWSYGCSPTSASMLFGYYDRTGYSNIYTGPAYSGVAPIDNSIWGNTTYKSVVCGEDPISATHYGIDDRTTNGHVDDYWINYNKAGTDPYLTNGWTQHAPYCAADFMGTNQSKFGNSDGSTSFYYYATGDPLYDYTSSDRVRDGCHGMRLFAESRGYNVVANYTQLIQGQASDPTKGFTFANFRSEIDAGHPVLIQVQGHTMLGFGYDATGNTVYIHDTWDYSDHEMTWGDSYGGMQQWGVTVIDLLPTTPTIPTVTGISPNSGPAVGGTTITITGTGFIAVTKVNFGGIPAAIYTVNSISQITATSPAGSSTVHVTVTTSIGTSNTSNNDQFIYTTTSAPTITSFSPISGRAGTTVTITGTNFTGATKVTFGRTAASSFTVESDTQIVAVVGKGSTGKISVITPNGTATSTDTFTFTRR